MNKIQSSSMMLLALFMLAFFGVKLHAEQSAPQPQQVFAHYYPQDKLLNMEWIIMEGNEAVTGFDCTIQKFNSDSTLSVVLNFGFDVDNENLYYKNDVDGMYYYTLYQDGISLEPGVYELTLKSITKDDESEPSLSTYLWFDEGETKNSIYFTQLPDVYAFVGQEFRSYIKAESTEENVIIKYSIYQAPEGMTIDANSGLITFNPTESGMVSYKVRATNADDANEYMEVYYGLIVNSCKDLATIKGKITYDESVENKSGYIQVIQISADGSYNQVAGLDVQEDGNFTLQVDKGVYYLYFMLFDKYDDDDYITMGEWYKDALTIEQAEEITVDCGELASIQMLVGDQKDFTKYNVSGYVKLDDGTPLPNSVVVFQSSYSESDSTFWGGYTKTVTTDENGYYEILLPDLIDYTAFCYVGENNNPGNYKPQYWENTYNPFEATVIKLTEDISGIDFIFNEEDLKYPDGSISGKVVNSENTPIEGAFVIAFLVKSLNGEVDGDLYQGFAAITNDEGEYKFEYMNYGEYILFAFPNDMNYSPGFYREDEEAALTWEDATIILHDGFTSLKDKDIILPLMEVVQGFGKIEGEVTSTGGGIRNDVAGDAISGASIFLVNEIGTTNKYNKSSNNGTYRLSGIAAGRYQLIVDKVGYRSHKEWVEIGEDGELNGYDIQLSPEIISSVEDKYVSTGLNVYPNPASSNIQMTINSTTNNLKVELYNMLGVEISNNNITSTIGVGTYSLDVSNLNSGLYILKVTDGQNIIFDKIIINR